MTLAQKLAALRKNAGLNMSELAEKIGVSRSLISKYEKGERMPGREVLVLLSEFYGVSVDALLGTGASHSVEFEVNGDIADRLKRLRKQAKLSQAELADILHVHQTAVSHWETDRATPDKDCLLLLAEFFNVSVDYLLGNDSEQLTTACISDNLLTEQEKVLLKHFRETTEEGRFRMIAAMFEIEKELK